MKTKKRVLFVCTGNSARSQMAEGILRQLAGDEYDVFSAGTAPKGLHPRTVEVMKEAGIDVSTHTSKDLAQFQGQSFDYVITVCDRARQQCPVDSPALRRFTGDSTILRRRTCPGNWKLFAACGMKSGIGSACSCWQTKTSPHFSQELKEKQTNGK
jgi:Protein-tyrosine-phosphatase